MPPVDDRSRLQSLAGYLRSNLRGQDHVLDRAAAIFHRGELGLARRDRPRGAFLAVGPTGTGKTELVLLCARHLFGDAAIRRFDLSEFQRPDAVERLLGADADDPGALGRLIGEGRPLVLLFDELEKAHPKVFDLFIQLLDPGHITLTTGRRIELQDCYLAFTSNLGAAEAARMARSSFSSIEQAVLRRLGESLRPEFLARIPEKFVFAPLPAAVQREIGELHVGREVVRLRSHGFDLQVTSQALEHLLRHGFDARLGARPLRQTVERELQDLVAHSLFSTGHGGGRVGLDSTGTRLVLEPT
ncbi:MAG: AAA family ATPase [Lacunisphaera sp.]|nr:AAA family ATPase [Lacunisphaera sp.]